jgi:hypothetical protein
MQVQDEDEKSVTPPRTPDAKTPQKIIPDKVQPPEES